LQSTFWTEFFFFNWLCTNRLQPSDTDQQQPNEVEEQSEEVSESDVESEHIESEHENESLSEQSKSDNDDNDDHSDTESTTSKELDANEVSKPIERPDSSSNKSTALSVPATQAPTIRSEHISTQLLKLAQAVGADTGIDMNREWRTV
jgi:cytoskeletal protein RodZ